MGQVVGRFLSQNDFYLQDPENCNRYVVYDNPHMLKFGDEEIVMTDAFADTVVAVDIEQLQPGPDLLSELMETVPLEQTDPPKIISTQLFP